MSNFLSTEMVPRTSECNDYYLKLNVSWVNCEETQKFLNEPAFNFL